MFAHSSFVRRVTVGRPFATVRSAIAAAFLLALSLLATSAPAATATSLQQAQSALGASAFAAPSPSALGACDTAGPIEVEATAGADPGPTAYATLKLAFDAINAGTHQGTINIEVCGNTTETVAAVINASGAGAAVYTTIAINPVGGAARTITGALATPLIDINGADNVTIDGLNTGGNALTISNTSTASTAGTSTIRFVGGATNNAVTNSTILGSSTTTLATAQGGTILFSLDAVTANGNDNNTISNNNIGPAGANLPNKAIFGLGSTSTLAIENSGVVINNNNIFDFFNATSSVSGIYLASGNDNWTISNNRIYQTATRTFTGTTLRYAGITLNSTAGTLGAFTITGNKIGFGAADGSGTTTITGSTNEFRGVDAASVNATTPTSIQNNTLSGINQTSARSSTTTTNSTFVGFMLGSTGGRFNVGDVTGNTIGSLDGLSTIVINQTVTAANAPIVGFYDFSVSSNTISNNNIGAITIQGAGTTLGFRGILVNTGSALVATINNNTIGGALAGGAITNTQVGAYAMYGIQTALPNLIVNDNTIRNMTCNANGASVNMSGLAISVSGTAGSTFARNSIHSLSDISSGASAGAIYAIDLTLTTAPNIVERNLVHSLSVTSTAAYQIYGLIVRGTSPSTAAMKNNMIRLGLDAAGASITSPFQIIGIRDSAGTNVANNYYNNSVYIGGTGVAAGASNSYALLSDVVTTAHNFQDNIFWNARSNAVGGGAAHIAVRVGGTTVNPAGLTSNFNDILASGTDGITGFYNSLLVGTLADWRTATGQDSNSFAYDPQFIAPNGTAATGDLHIHPTNPTPIESSGLAIVGVTDDFDGDARASFTPTDMGADAGNFVLLDISPPAIGYAPLANTVSTINRALAATITDATGVPTAGVGLPVLYYRKGASDPFVSTQGVSGGGSSYNFTIDYSLVTGGSVTTGDIIQYYVVAQDTVVPTPNVGAAPGGGAAGFTASPPAAATPPTTPSSYTILPSISGTKTVGAGGDFATLTLAAAALNSSVLTGPVTLSLTDATTTATFPVTINANAGSSSTNTITIKPATGVTTALSGNASTCLLILNGADWVILDGSNAVGGSTRDTTMTNTSTGTSSAVVCLETATGSDGATNNIVKNVNIVGNSNTTTLFGVFSGSTTVSISSTGTGNNNNTIQNNAISKTQYGIYSGGASAANKNTGTLITQNQINAITPNNVQVGGILVNFESGITISQNNIAHINTSGTTPAFGITLGVRPSNSFTTFTGSEVVGATVSRNTIDDVVRTGDGTAMGIGVASVATVGAATNTIVNNSLSQVRSTAATPSDFGVGILVGGGANGSTNVYFNSVAMTGAGPNSAPSFAIVVGGTNPVVDLRNNIFYNTQTPTTGKTYAIALAYASPYTNLTSNFNDFVSTGATANFAVTGGLAGTDRTSLAAWQTETGKDANSITTDPLFTSLSDLHLQAASPADSAGTPIGSVTNDIDGDARPATKPDIGSDELVSNLTITPTSVPFGSLAVGSTSSEMTVTLANTGAGSLDVTTLDVAAAPFARTGTGTCSASLPITIASGADCTLTYTFAPTVTGAANQTLTVTANGPGSGTIALSGTGLQGNLTITPTSVPFGNQLVGSTSSEMTVTLANTGNMSLDVTVLDAAAAPFARTGTGTCSASLPITIAASGSCTLTYTFAPSATGAANQTLTVTANAPGSGSIALSGTGIQGNLTISPTSIPFGNQAVGSTSGPQAVTLGNNGTASLQVTALDAAVAPFSRVGGNCSGTLPITIAAGNSCTLSYQFAPTATGAANQTLTVTANAPGSGSIALSGTGVQGNLTITPTSVPFADQTINTTSGAQTVTLGNTGNASLNVTALTAAAAPFARSGGTCSAVPIAIPASSSCTLTYTFTPTVTGAANQTLTVTADSPGSGSIALSGNGIPAAGVCGTGNPVEVTASAGTPGPTGYPTLKGGFDAINAGTHQGTLAIAICGNTTEAASAVLNASGTGAAVYTTATINPAGGAARTVSGALAAPLVDLAGADNVTIDGLNTGGNALTFSNTSTSATAGTSTLRFINGATGNTITRTTILGSSTAAAATAGGNVLFSTSTVAGGNSNNTISANSIGPAGANLPSKGVMGLGSASPNNNTGNVVDGNNIFDFFLAATGNTAGVSIQANNTNWTISNNRLYQTGTRTFTGAAGVRYAGILVASAGNTFTITGNVIGFGAADGTGTTTITGTGTGLGNEVRGIVLTNASATAGSYSSIQGNTISGINQTTSRNSTTTDLSAFIGIQSGSSATDAPANIGNVTGNTIGSLDGSSTIVVSSSSVTASTSSVQGILDFNFVGNVSVSNNNIGSITINNNGTGTTLGFRGILVGSTTGVTHTVSNNTIGGTAAGSITDNVVGAYSMYAIQVGSANVIATGNLVRNMVGNSTTASGVVSSGLLTTASTGANTISQNTIHSLSNNSGAASNSIYALYTSFAAVAGNLVERNYVHSLSITSTATTSQLAGILPVAGNGTYQNNMVRLGVDATGAAITSGYTMYGMFEIAGTNNLYNNSVYIGGSGVAAASNTFAFVSNVVTNVRNYQDNIFWNARDNASGTGKNYAISVGGTAPNPAGLASSYNDLLASGSGGFTGLFNATDQTTLADWQAATGQDANSIAVNPLFVAPTGTAATVDLHIQTASPAESAGTPIAAVTNDFDNDPRPATKPDMGADELTGALTITPPTLNFGNQTVGIASGEMTVTLGNSGTGSLDVTTLDAAAAPFARTGTGTCSATLPITLAGGGSCTLTYTFTPAATGPFNQTLTVTANSPGSGTIDLSGNGVPPGNLTISPATVPFGDQTVGSTSGPMVVTLGNTGGSSLDVTALTTAVTPFSRVGGNCSGTLPITIAAGNSCTLSYQFAPTVTGVVSQMLTVTANAPGSGTITLSGNGTPAGQCSSGNPVEVTASAGTPGPTGYPTLKGGFDAINAGTHQGTLAIAICGNTTEAASAVLNASGTGAAVYTTATINPAGGAARTVSGALAAPLVDLAGADNVTIDGLNTGGNALTFSNTSTSATAGTSTLRFINGATGNTITRTTILGSSTAAAATAGGNVLFSTSTVAGGNSNNTISANSIGPAGANLPSKGVMGLGSASPNNNTGNVVDGNNIFDFFLAATGNTAGVSIQANNTNWTISNNRLYQTGTRTFTGAAGVRYAGILVASAGNTFTITGNVIGFGAADGTGTTTITGTGTGLGNEVRGIVLTNASATAGSYSSIQGNTISGINQTTSRNSTTTDLSAFIGIQSGSSATDAPANIGNVTGNTIGSLDGSSTIVVSSSSVTASTSSVQGILDFNFVGNVSVSNNNIGSITINNNGTGTTLGFRGILVGSTTGVTHTVSNNTIGGTAAGSITDNVVGAYSMYAIQVGSANVIATGNLVRNMVGNSTTASGVVSSGLLTTASTGANTISQNTIHSLSNNSGAASNSIYALYTSFAAVAGNLVERNYVHSLSITSTATTSQLAGILPVAGNGTYQNNMVRLGVDATGAAITSGYTMYGMFEIAGTNNLYNNSVYIGGSGVAAASNTFAFVSNVVTNVRNYQDNIFWNARDNASGTGKNYAISVGGTAPNPAGLASSYNDLLASGSGGFTGLFNATDQTTLADWQAATGQDANSIAVNPLFVAPTGTAATVDLHIQTASPAESAGTPIAAVTNDFDNDPRPATKPDMGADELTGALTITPPTLNFGNQTVGIASGEMTVTLGNSGTGSLDVTTLDAAAAPFARTGTGTCSATLPITLAGGGSCTLTYTFTPAATGPFNQTLTVTANSPGSGTIALSGTGIAGALTVTPSSVPFGNQLVGTTSGAQTVTLGNTGAVSLNVTALTAAAAPFARTGAGTCSASLPITIPASGSCTLTYTFSPSVAGAANQTLTVTSTAGGGSIGLSGTGIQGNLAISPTSVPFANQTVGTTSPASTVTLSNTGTASLNVTALTAAATPFARLGGTCSAVPITIPAAGSCTLTYTFAPTATGPFNQTLTVTANAPGSGTIALSGTGIQGNLVVSPTTVDFDSPNVGTVTPEKTVTLSNTGNASLNVTALTLASAPFVRTVTGTCGNSLPITIPASGSCTLTYTFNPTSAGVQSQPFTVTANAPGSGSIFTLTGEGVADRIFRDGFNP